MSSLGPEDNGGTVSVEVRKVIKYHILNVMENTITRMEGCIKEKERQANNNIELTCCT